MLQRTKKYEKLEDKGTQENDKHGASISLWHRTYGTCTQQSCLKGTELCKVK